MKKITHNKLVRDRIPNILIGHGLSFKAHKCNDPDFIKELSSKLEEEAKEVAEKVHWYDHITEVEPTSKKEDEAYISSITEEMADVLEVFINLAKALNITTDDIEKAADKKRKERGGFEDRIFLEWSEDANEAEKKGKLK